MKTLTCRRCGEPSERMTMRRAPHLVYGSSGALVCPACFSILREASNRNRRQLTRVNHALNGLAAMLWPHERDARVKLNQVQYNYVEQAFNTLTELHHEVLKTPATLAEIESVPMKLCGEWFWIGDEHRKCNLVLGHIGPHLERREPGPRCTECGSLIVPVTDPGYCGHIGEVPFDEEVKA